MNEQVFLEPFDQDAETGAGTGDHRENDPHCAGFTRAEDKLWRSHFQHANHLTEVSYDQARPAYELGYGAAHDRRYRGRDFAEVEMDLENGWLNVRTGGREWASVREYVRSAFVAGRTTGFVKNVSAYGGSATPDRPSFADPIAGGIDPTAPGSAEQTLAWQKDDDAPRTFPLGSQGGFGEKSETARGSEAGNEG